MKNLCGYVSAVVFFAVFSSVSGLSCYTCFWTDDPTELSEAECEFGNLTANQLGYFRDTLHIPKADSEPEPGKEVETVPYYSHCMTMTGTLYGYRFVYRLGFALRDYNARDGKCETTFDAEEWDFLYKSGVIGMNRDTMINVNSPRMCYCKGDGCNSSSGLKALGFTLMMTMAILIVGCNL